ncbi:D-galactarate dehydratase [Aliiruegeria sabulilitoris]|uniref:D-galactarate dehydratase n=1 Tax=Aliiruegeria sabulilitoris TaxID=1510458 RepID=UPI000ABBB9E7|nr:D-galactarate dehydratase [Aliiruegeria sabulilitoris]
MNRRNWIVLLVLVTAGCGVGAKLPIGKPVSTVAGTDAEIGTQTNVSAPVPAADAQTPEQLDTTTAQERAAAAAAPAVISEVRLGTTIASLGDPTDPGFWAETGLVDQVVMGRLEYPGAGTSVQVELRPSGGSPGSGTRVSLPAMRVLQAPLTELPELVVFSG